MKKIQNILINTRTMAVLMLVYAAAMGYATFLENDYGTPTAKALIYEAKWFELVMFLLILNFIGNISRYRLWKREKWPVLIFHLSFVLLFIGGAITRYISYEGIMHIREGDTSNEIVTDKHFLKIQIEDKGDVLRYQDIPYLMSPLNKNLKASYNFHDQKISVRTIDFVQRKKDSLVADPNGLEYLHFVSAGDKGRVNYYLKPGESKSLGGTLVSYNRPIDGAIEFKSENGKLFIKTPVDANYMVMATQDSGNVKQNVYEPLALRSLYTINDIRIVVPEGLKKGKLIAFEGDKKKDQSLPDALTMEVQGPKTKQTVELVVERGNPNLFKQISIDGLNIMLGFGPKVYTTPFALRLEDFVMETYPGSSSPSAYESHVTIIDEGKETPYKIYMNNVLNHKGYRFFQASFDEDRQGTVLSVNHDFWGTLITYIGYFFLFTAMFVIFFWKGTHFWKLNKMLKNINKTRTASAVALFIMLGLNAQKIETHSTSDGSRERVQVQHSADDGHNHAPGESHAVTAPAPEQPSQNSVARSFSTMKMISADEAIAKTRISREHAEKFAYLLVQNYDGRIVPMSTQATDVLRKLYKKDKFKGTGDNYLTAEQWFLSVNTDTPSWTMVPLIKIGSKGGEELKRKTKANDDGYASLMSLFPSDASGNLKYVLEEDYNLAFRKKPAEQSNYDKEVIAVNERVQIFNEFFSGQFMRIVPVKNDPNSTWHSWLDQNFEPDMESQKVMGPYFAAVVAAQQSGNWSQADAELKKLSDYQQNWGKNVVPAKSKVDLEVFMTKVDINFRLLIFYTFIALILIVLGFVHLFRPSRVLDKIIKTVLIIGLIGWVLQLLGLMGRWYISGHAPWSNGYEAIVFISWVGITSGLVLYRNSNALIPAAGFTVAVIMMGFAHGGSALDPQITPLVPVLKSYWLIIHVAIITSSYGFFGLSFVIAIICLIFYILARKKDFKAHNDRSLKELTIVSEMSLTIGLYALTIGTFMGGIWANESWGRYWSWDPKETWAFISVMVYAFVLHMRLVPGLRSRWAYHVATMFAISSIVMTYFGVNYYLSGLHSYAAGDPIPVPAWVYIGSGGMLLLALVSYLKFRTFDKSKKS
ncbi:cytochrome c biogenesis protein CcsA [Kaistella sp. PBT33-4]|uniref:cytochrome c biogenesis protein n=1 Tax=Kaistella sp. PBT33-4 TaxID=3032000 RepID=UPI0023D8A034|nr:cytochrome c biogenesis protein CcsA [Kaistella sp. PBT33-4]MDF0719824.1 cytochrome c biogenesis protein CcsA [Kaistella sp. PBT33-4]